METTEGNKLIAEFMGQAGAFDPRDRIYHYDTSWDWLMPVVEKIEKDFCIDFEVVIYSVSCYIRQIKTGENIGYGTGKKIEAVYQAVTEFIQWYNTTLRKQHS